MEHFKNMLVQPGHDPRCEGSESGSARPEPRRASSSATVMLRSPGQAQGGTARRRSPDRILVAG
eukprot:738676-Pelagomonas_calceolata.AAC.1